MTLLPAARAGATFFTAIKRGWLNGLYRSMIQRGYSRSHNILKRTVICATTPKGTRST